jgi:hypothetical protein
VTTAPASIYDQLDADEAKRRERLSAPDALANAALWYAAAGWPVFPLKPAGKTPLTRNGFKDASTNLTQVAAWWRTTPAANIGVPTGVRFDVIDVDGPEGFASLATIRHHNCPPDCCAETVCPGDPTVLGMEILAKAYTGGGGRHLLVAPLGHRNGARIMPGIDIRGQGGYIVAPPSRHESGRLYDWLTPPPAALLAAVA